jgi:hypothetical protein
MTNPSAGLTGDGGSNPVNTTNVDDASDSTPIGSSVGKLNDNKEVEKTWRIRFMSSSSVEKVHPSKIHLQLIQEVQERFGGKVKVLSNNNVLMPKVDILTWTEDRHSKHFKIHPENGHPRQVRQTSSQSIGSRKSSRFIVHRVRSSVSLREIKSIPKIHELLKNHNCYVNEHRWTEDVWETVQIGFFQGLNPQFYSVDDATSMVSEAITKACSKTKIPKFKLSFCTPQTTIHNAQLRTKAYAIETEKSTSMEMLKILKHTYRETTEFIPFQMRSKHPEAYARILLQQSKMINDQHVIVLQNISPDTMYYLSERIGSIDGVIDMKEVTYRKDLGKYRVLVHKDDFHSARKSLQFGLQKWYVENVPEDAKPRSNRFPGDPEVAPIMSDGDSSGEDTYYSTSVNTAMSYDSVSSDITNDFSLKTVDTSKVDQSSNASWAGKVKAGSQPNQASSKAEAPQTVQQTTSTASLVSDLASSRAEVDELKVQLAKIQAQQEAESQEKKVQEAHRKKEAELQATAHKLEMDKQAEEQRRLFQQQMDDQRRELEQKAEIQRRELEQTMQEQIARAIQSHLNRTPTILNDELQQMFVNQGRQIQMLTRLMMQQSLNRDQVSPATTSTGKRTAEERNTTDGEANEDVIVDMTLLHTPEGRKRADLRRTPQKRGISKDAPSPSSLSMQSSPSRNNIDQPMSQKPWTPDSVSTVYPDNPKHPLHYGGDGPSDNEHESDTIMSGPRFSPYHETQTGALDDDPITPTQLEDIYRQHDGSQGVDDSSQNRVDPCTESGEVPRSPKAGDKSQPPQAKPEEVVTFESENEGC